MGFGLNPGIPGAGDTELATEAKQDAIISAIQGISGSAQYYAVIADNKTTGGVVYVGYADPGTSTSAASWRIKKVDISNYPIITWADGDSDFDNVFDDRESLIYS